MDYAANSIAAIDATLPALLAEKRAARSALLSFDGPSDPRPKRLAAVRRYNAAAGAVRAAYAKREFWAA